MVRWMTTDYMEHRANTPKTVPSAWRFQAPPAGGFARSLYRSRNRLTNQGECPARLVPADGGAWI